MPERKNRIHVNNARKQNGRYCSLQFFSFFTQKSICCPPYSYPILDIIPSNGKRNDTSIKPINAHKMITRVGSKTAI